MLFRSKNETDSVRDELPGKVFKGGSYFCDVGAEGGGGGGELLKEIRQSGGETSTRGLGISMCNGTATATTCHGMGEGDTIYLFGISPDQSNMFNVLGTVAGDGLGST